MGFKQKLKASVLIARPLYWLPGIASALSGELYANQAGLSLLPIVSVAFLCGLAEVLNDIADVRTDTIESRRLIVGIPISGGSGQLQLNALSIQVAWAIAAILFFAGGLMTLIMGSPVITLYLIGALVGVFYSFPPLRLKARTGWGAVAQGIGYGPIAFFIGVFGVGGGWSVVALAFSLLIGIWVALVGATADLLDYDHDARAGIKTLTEHLGRRKMTLLVIGSGWSLFFVASAFYRNWSAARIGVGVVMLGGMIFLTKKLWDARHRQLPVVTHVVSVILEVVFPIYIIL